MLVVHLFGKFTVHIDGRPVELPLRAAQSLLAYLLLTAGTAHRREQLAGLLWPEAPEANAKGNLRHILWRLRKALGARRFVVADELTVAFDASAEYWLDARVVDQKAEASLPTDELIGIVSAYEGELLPGFYDDWVVLERERLQAAFERKMVLLLDSLVQAQRWDDVLEWGERWIALGQVPEPAYRALMVAHARLGNASNMAAVFHRCREALLKELGVEPSEQTHMLFEQLSRGEWPRALPVEERPTKRRGQVPAGPPADVRPGPAVAETAPEISTLDWLVHGQLIGRERELAEARSLWQRAAAGEASVLLFSGEPGVGKTRFVRELAAIAGESAARVLTGECYAEGGASYAAIAQVIESADLLSLAPKLPSLVLADLIAVASGLRPHFPNVPANPPLDPQAEQLRLFESVVSVFAGLCASAPVLLVIDDVHWADSGTLALVRHLARRASRLRLKLAIAVTYRDAELDPAGLLNTLLDDLNRERLAWPVRLQRLSREQTRDLLAAMFQEDITPEFLDGIYREAEGNPFFVEEVCRALIQEGKIYREGGRWRRPSMDEIQVPPSVRLAIDRRIARLPAQTQDVLRMAAVIGREFNFETLETASELDEDALIDALEGADGAQLIAEVRGRGRETYAFTHVLIPAALRESLSGLRRHRLHRAAAAAIESLRPDDFEALAYHFGQAGDKAPALRYTIQAADRARKAYANEDAIRLYTQALGLLPDDPDRRGERFDLLAARSQVYHLIARRDAQRADIAAMQALADQLNDDARRCDAALALANYCLGTDHALTKEPAEFASNVARRLKDPVREGEALLLLGESAKIQEDYFQSHRALKEAESCFRIAGLSDKTAVCLHSLSVTLERLGELSAAEQAAREAIALCRASGDQREEASSLRRLGVTNYSQGRYAEAFSVTQTALALHRQVGDLAGEGYTLNNLGAQLGRMARLEEAEVSLRQALEIAEATDSTSMADNAIRFLVFCVFILRGDYEAGLAFLESQLTKAESASNPFLAARIRSEKAKVLGDLGQFGAAIELMSAALATGHFDSTGYQPNMLTRIARWQAERREYVQARFNLQNALDWWEKAGDPAGTTHAHANAAYIAWLCGDPAEMRSGLARANQALGLLIDRTNLPLAAFALTNAARLHLALGDANRSLTLSREAVRLMAQIPVLWDPNLWNTLSILLIHSRALRANDLSEEAAGFLMKAYEHVMLVAGKLQDENLRRSWLENVRDNREIVADWTASTSRGGRS